MAANDRALDALYAGLTPEERARLLARLFREHDDRELDRLRWTIPDHAAGVAYNRAAAALRWLHGMFPSFVALATSQMQTEFWRLAWLTTSEFGRWKALGWLRRAWWFVDYPAIETEYRHLVSLERGEPETLAAYCEWLAEFEGTEPGLRPDVAALLQGLPDDLRREFRDDWSGEPPSPEAVADDVRRGAAIAKRLRALLNGAVARGELPTPTRRREGAALTRGACPIGVRGRRRRHTSRSDRATSSRRLNWLGATGSAGTSGRMRRRTRSASAGRRFGGRSPGSRARRPTWRSRS